MSFWRKKQHRKLRREIYSFFDTSISIALLQKREKDGRSLLACARSDRSREPSSSTFFYLGFAATVKTEGFSWPVYYSLGSSAKFDIVRVDKTRIWDTLRAI